ncbi:hypothetical protein PICMEDRAFT_88250 [Pichia membranifaciens NRRL Y-2026]|uniref:Uncharacterized protein n=1 Tax=Pichia membranifaciens NRRL Y-2026 TaxID=763406 RepID=A0A1E3NRZ7_9ASCO|nr:hypothetical protein PICMEDRAFT_88250 [Pichia membranifaciens NRRL Y-2026]ODQ48885.1 hypothetical protein PICMEDRAFT_88250 [Pichia membranifaciens NRRL Y-2026]
MNTHRRKSLIPKPSLPNSRKDTSRLSPAASPRKQDSRRASISPISFSSIPVSNSTTASSASSINSRKRSGSSSLEEYLSTLQTHITADVEAERSYLSEILLEIDSRLFHYHQLCTKLRDLQKREANLSNTIFEYEIGIPVKQSLLDQEVLKVEDDLARVEERIDLEKTAYAKVIEHKEQKLHNVLQELVNDAKRDDAETVKLRSERMKKLSDEKEELLRKIEVAKVNMDSELQQLRESFSSEKDLKIKNFKEKETLINLELQKLEEQHEKLKKEYSTLSFKLETDQSTIKSLEKKIQSKKIKIEELQYRLSDMKSLISELQLDLDNALTLFSKFESGEYKETRAKWLLAKTRLQQEKHKRLKIEIQIREISGIPNIVILDTDSSHALKNSSLNEFFKPLGYDWKSEMLTALESSLEGVSSCVYLFNEDKSSITNLRSIIVPHLEHVLKEQDRFSHYDTNFTELDTLNTISNILEDSTEFQISKFPLDVNALYVEMTNSKTLNLRKAIIFLITASVPSELKSESVQQFGKAVQCITIAENISASWSESLQLFASLKPLRLRESYSFLNK